MRLDVYQKVPCASMRQHRDLKLVVLRFQENDWEFPFLLSSPQARAAVPSVPARTWHIQPRRRLSCLFAESANKYRSVSIRVKPTIHAERIDVLATQLPIEVSCRRQV